MVAITLRQAWINLVATGAGVTAPTTGRGLEGDVGGEVRGYAGGRQRFIGKEGVSGQFTLTLRLLTLTQVVLLESWRGRLVQVRDHRGQQVFGVYVALTRVEHKNPALYDASIVVRAVTYDEGV